MSNGALPVVGDGRAEAKPHKGRELAWLSRSITSTRLPDPETRHSPRCMPTDSISPGPSRSSRSSRDPRASQGSKAP